MKALMLAGRDAATIATNSGMGPKQISWDFVQAAAIPLRGPSKRKAAPKRLYQLLLGLSACSAIVRPAAAQEIDLLSIDDILIREESRGVDAGGLQLFPQITADTFYDDNVFNSQTNHVDDIAFRLRPSLTVGPALERHSMRLSMEAAFTRHADVTREDNDQYRVALTNRFDLGDRTEATLQAYYSELIEERGTFGDQYFTDEPISYSEIGGLAGLSRRGAVLGLSGQVFVSTLDYDDATVTGAPLDLSFRDLDRVRGNVQAEYRIGPRLSAFSRLSLNKQHYQVQSTDDLDSWGGSSLAGVIFQPTELTELEFGVGYVWQNFASPQFEDFTGVDYYIDGLWAPSERLRVSMSGQRTIDRSPFPETPAVVRSNFDIRTTYAVTEKVAIGARAGVEDLNYRGIDRSETRYRLAGNIEYRLNSQLTAFVTAGYRKQSTNDVLGREYSGMEVGTGIGWRL